MELKQYLKENRWSNREFARQVGMNECYACNVIRRRAKISLDLACKIEDWTKGKVKLRELLPEQKKENEDGDE